MAEVVNDEKYVDDVEDDEDASESECSDMFDFSSLNLMDKISKMEKNAQQNGMVMDEDDFYQNLASLNQFTNHNDDDDSKEETAATHHGVEGILNTNLIIIIMSHLDAISS